MKDQEAKKIIEDMTKVDHPPGTKVILFSQREAARVALRLKEERDALQKDLNAIHEIEQWRNSQCQR